MSRREQPSIWDDWPVVPENLRPRPLYHRANLRPDEVKSLEEKGWSLVDTRLLPDNEMKDRTTALLAYLSGVRQGSITHNPDNSKALEVEMRACGLHLGKGEVTAPKRLEDSPIEDILNLHRKVSWEDELRLKKKGKPTKQKSSTASQSRKQSSKKTNQPKNS